MFHNSLADVRQVLETPRVIEAVMDWLIRQRRHLIEMGGQPGSCFHIEQEGVLHPLHQGLGRAQALKYQGRGAAVAQEIDPPQGAGLVAKANGIGFLSLYPSFYGLLFISVYRADIAYQAIDQSHHSRRRYHRRRAPS